VKMLIIATAALLAAPAVAQVAPAAGAGSDAQREMQRAARSKRGDMWANVSPEGRAILRETLGGDPRDREATRAARDRINALVGAEKLDVPALRRAMDEERRLIDGQHARRQASMLAAIQKLSAADRKAFAEDALRARALVEARTAQWRRNSQGGRPGRDATPPGTGSE
jgi:hypothetical protein